MHPAIDRVDPRGVPPATRRADSQQLVRQWALLRLLGASTTGRSVKELAEQLRSTKATIARDLATLERDFAIVEEARGKQKRMYKLVDEVQALTSLRLGVSELLAVYAALASMHGTAGSPLHDDLGTLALKLRGLLGERFNGKLDAMVAVFAPHARGYVDYRGQADTLDALTDAITRRRVCTLTYHSTWQGTTRTHRARPLRLVWHDAAMYLLACLGQHERVTTLAVHRIRALEPTSETFAPPRLDLDAHIGKAFGIFVSDAEVDVEIEFAADIAWQLEERVFHPAEHKQRRPDGTLVYRVRSSAQWEILPWVMSFGPQARLVGPPAWRAALRASLQAAAARYDDD